MLFFHCIPMPCKCHCSPNTWECGLVRKGTEFNSICRTPLIWINFHWAILCPHFDLELQILSRLWIFAWSVRYSRHRCLYDYHYRCILLPQCRELFVAMDCICLGRQYSSVCILIWSVVLLLLQGKTSMTGILQTFFYFGYMGLLSLTLGTLCGTIGHFAASKFVRTIFQNVKLD